MLALFKNKRFYNVVSSFLAAVPFLDDGEAVVLNRILSGLGVD